MLSKTRNLSWLLIAGLVFIADQCSKLLVSACLDANQQLMVLPNLNFVLAYNHGAAFGFLSTAAGWQRWFFIAIAVIVSIVIVAWIKKLKASSKLEVLGLALILGGALGNLLDRIMYGHVVDFIDFYVKHWHWYTYNLGDIEICVGAGLLQLVQVSPSYTQSDKDHPSR